jgi:Zn-dependent protease with chaperone function
MDLSGIFNSYLGMYVAQSFFHSLVAVALVDGSIRAWKVESPLGKQRLRLIVIVLPVFSFPVYQLINPDRGSLSFRLEALFDSSRWLNLELPGGIPMGVFFGLMLLVTALVFLLQEMIPVLGHAVESRRSSFDSRVPEEGSIVHEAMEGLEVEKPDVYIVDDDDLLLFSTTGRRPAVYLSSGLLESFSLDEIRVALAHEIAHIRRSRRPLLVMMFFLRMLMFFNPVVLVDFRRIVQEEEKICDDIAVSMTKKPSSMVEVLRKFRYTHGEDADDEERKLPRARAALEKYSHELLLDSRMARLERAPGRNPEGSWGRFLLTAATVSMINYFIV